MSYNPATHDQGGHTRSPEIVCGAEDLKVMLAELSRQFVEADRRNLGALRDMQSRLENMVSDADSMREHVPTPHASAFARIEEGVQSLAGRMGQVTREREIAHHDAEMEADDKLRAAEAAPVNHSAAGDASEPWHPDSAEALAQMYESGAADIAPAPLAGIPRETIRSASPLPAAEPGVVASALPAPSATDGDRAWLDERFAAIAERIEHSLGAMRPADTDFSRLDERLAQLEIRFSAALEDVATRADVDGLRIVEAHINELAAQFERAEQQLQRLDQIEQHIGSFTSQLSDERLAHVAAQLAPAGHQGPTADEIEAVAIAVADRVASMMPAPASHSHDQGGTDELRRVIENFAAGQRETEEHTSTMLDTMQQALIRMLDRMDAIENAGTYGGPHDFMPAAPVSVAPAPPPAAAQVAAAPAASPSMARVEPSFADSGADQRMEERVPSLAPQPKDEIRASAAADARRAAQKMAAQAADKSAAPSEAGKVRRGAPAVQITAPEAIPAEAKPRSRAPLMVAGVALIAAVGVLAASVGFSRGGVTGAAQTAAKGKLTIDNGAGEAGEAQSATAASGPAPIAPTPSIEPGNSTPRPAPAAAAPRPGASAEPRPVPQSNTENTTDAQEIPVQKASIRQEPSPLGMVVSQPTSVPPNSDLARARQQRNMASLAVQLAALQANPNSVPSSLLPQGISAAKSEAEPMATEAAATGEMPPAFIGPTSLRTAAQKGDPSAEFEVAARFAEGRGIGQDFKQAITWYQRSAQRGFAPAQYRLGTLFERGVGTKSDVARAKIWYGRAAEQGHVKAMHNLAVLNAGRDGTPDYAAAHRWFTAAAERGLADSQYNLGVLFESGLGLQRDYKQAYHWLSLAARGGDKDAGRRRDQVRMKIDESEIATLEQAVEAWRASPVDSTVNDPRVAGETWKSRQAANR